jgi:hypothetical protein
MNIVKTFQGGYQISALKDNQFITRQYIGYTCKQAVTLFKSYYNEYR